ncbi:SWIM zinc finger family protein [Lactiplantibacillus fabifermentans]|uniref:SWIM-type domain-containing protein n=2 Tax=Lactiplantibacillus fabifermentans TaxID=483011 RepID=A0A0R2NL72_9LACO|nr:SWIM zinc finger family protein [Lactiplantibacillus fabifermentans]ETY74625.1 hypothetical protein LFAB_06155 [Lactiplantibacillus fabifermentans T30PCM01]KRO26488.1 hypothetical protein DY78_GL000880 [Lactiplantibacillus fabifermentans DSM 21115]
MDWKSRFPAKILERGYQYNRRALIRDFKVNHTTITATVLGTNSYNVRIQADPFTFYCNCPYATSGHLCKHMAAVLFYNEQQHSHFSPITADHSPQRVFQLTVLSYINAQDFDRLTQLTNELFHTCAQSELSAAQLATKLTWILEQLLVTVPHHHELMQRCQWTQTTYLQLATISLTQPPYDEAPAWINFKDTCSEAWCTWVKLGDYPFNHYLFHWLCENVTQLPWPASLPLEDVLFDFHLYKRPNELRIKLAVIDRQLAKAPKITHETPIYIQTWFIEWVRYRIPIMAALELPPAATLNFCTRYCSDPVIANFFLRQCRDLDEKQTALTYLKMALKDPELTDEDKQQYQDILRRKPFSWQHPFFELIVY